MKYFQLHYGICTIELLLPPPLTLADMKYHSEQYIAVDELFGYSVCVGRFGSIQISLPLIDRKGLFAVTVRGGWLS